MPSVAQAVQEPVYEKKRRRVDVECSGGQIMKSDSYSNHQHSVADVPYIFGNDQLASNEPPSLRRRIITPRVLLPNSGAYKRQRIIRPSPFLHTPTEHTQDSYFPLSHTPTSSPHPYEGTTLYTPHSTTPWESSSVVTGTEAVRKLDLSPCHICHRKPTSKHELESFADCEGCAKRTCLICIRKCAGWDPSEVAGLESSLNQDAGFTFTSEDETGGVKGGTDRSGAAGREEMNRMSDRSEMLRMGEVTEHRDMVCSRCCVERGREGDVWCLGCLKAEGSAR